MAQPAMSKLILEGLLAEGVIDQNSSILAVCAGEFDRVLFELVGLTNVTFSNLDVGAGSTGHGKAVRPEDGLLWQQADAHALPFDTDAFSLAFVSDGLHHCQRPHLALTEMCRVSRRAVVVIESRDSAAMRMGARLRVVQVYEINRRLLKTREHGGMNFGPIPNHVYRWTEREFEKTVRSFDPSRDWRFAFYHAMHVPPRVGSLTSAAARAIGRIAPRQGNSFGMVAYPGERHSWLMETEGNGLRIGPSVSVARPPKRRAQRHRITSTDKWMGWPKGLREDPDIAKE